jgi:Glycosyl transferase family 2
MNDQTTPATLRPLRASVILFDGGFRESFHTLDFLAGQTLPADRWETIWVDWRDRVAPDVVRHENVRKVCLGQAPPYHIGRMVNEGVREATGDLLVILDGDVCVRPDFLAEVVATHEQIPDLVMHIRRWDQPQHQAATPRTIESLETTCEPLNPTNYGGCCSLERNWFEVVNGYTELPEFADQSGVAMEFYHRLMNIGLSHLWHPGLKLYHPWHPHDAPSDDLRRVRQHAVIGHVVTKRVKRADPGYHVASVG